MQSPVGASSSDYEALAKSVGRDRVVTHDLHQVCEADFFTPEPIESGEQDYQGDTTGNQHHV